MYLNLILTLVYQLYYESFYDDILFYFYNDHPQKFKHIQPISFTRNRFFECNGTFVSCLKDLSLHLTWTMESHQTDQSHEFSPF